MIALLDVVYYTFELRYVCVTKAVQQIGYSLASCRFLVGIASDSGQKAINIFTFWLF